MKKENMLIVIFVAAFLLASIFGYELEVDSLKPIVYNEGNMTFGFTSLAVGAAAAFAAHLLFSMKKKKS